MNHVYPRTIKMKKDIASGSFSGKWKCTRAGKISLNPFIVPTTNEVGNYQCFAPLKISYIPAY